MRDTTENYQRNRRFVVKRRKEKTLTHGHFDGLMSKLSRAYAIKHRNLLVRNNDLNVENFSCIDKYISS